MTTPFSNLFAAYDQAYFLDLFGHLYPDWYIEPLKSPGPGYELIQAYSKVGERLGLAANRVDDCAYILSAPLGTKARVELTLSRPNAAAGQVIVLKGSVFATSVGDYRFATIADVVFGAGDLGPYTVTAEAEAVGYEYNVRGERTTATNIILPGEIDAPYSLLEDPPYPPIGLPNIAVRQIPDAMGGAPAALEEHGRDRGLPYSTGETQAQYAARIRQASDTVSPDAIRRVIAAAFDPLGLSPTVIETWEPAYQTCYDWYDGVPNPIFAYDDPRPEPPGRYWNRWLDEIDYRGAFFVVVPNLAPMAEYGLCYDDPGVAPADFTNTLGARAESAYDVPILMPTGILIGCYDGVDIKKAALFAGLLNTLRSIKAGGIFATVELEGQ